MSSSTEQKNSQSNDDDWGLWVMPTTVYGLKEEIVTLQRRMIKAKKWDRLLYKDRLDACEQHLYLIEKLNTKLD